ncbi:acyltransferase family protein [Actinokineospora iranica]|uniref:Peptidoglycan/LPS O-acetylase OafA/YrhL, contains acyltransferase and SGNH-hydrolase domains n=1 Tax=Actinokineospora iranica TaxID=1271860 RepID=A0A1G6Z6M1_9PSEU|nr:acyltransferase [Actinokineospora iranica]SDD98404.1 Peptidoglycan/LPS O-acetylase OafA/YrhL, contains acyltransferase and SGNH-hydrolase domains [Actinokineospora iranica]
MTVPNPQQPNPQQPNGGQPASGQAKPQQGKFNLEGYRAVAAIVVVVFHAYQHNRYGEHWFWPLEGTFWHHALMNTDMLVDMFFILSGFLLGYPYAKAALGVGKPKPARAFLLRRAVRLIPLYLIVVLVVWAISNPVLPGDWRDLVLHLTFTHVWSNEKIFYTNGPAWTLGVEAYFYVLLAVLGAWAQRRLPRMRSKSAQVTALLTGTAVLIAISLVYKFWAVYAMRFPVDGWSIWFNPIAKLDIFAIGLLLAIACAAGLRWPNAGVRTLVGLSGAGVITLGIWLRYNHMPETFSHTFFGAGIMLVVAATALSLADGPRWLRWAPMVSLSTVSYSIYLWHEPILRVIDGTRLLPRPGDPAAFYVTAVVLVAVAVPVAYLSYRVIEVPAQRVMGAFDRQGRPRDYYLPLPSVTRPVNPSHNGHL